MATLSTTSGECPLSLADQAARAIKTFNLDIIIARCEFTLWIIDKLKDVCITRRYAVTMEMWEVFHRLRDKKITKK